MRDLTKEQFRRACSRHGFKSEGFLGYYDIGGGRIVSVLNAGANRRAQLAYLIKAAEHTGRASDTRERERQ